MAKWANDLAMDAMLDWIAECDTLTVCSTQPTTYAQATSTYTLATATITPGDGNGDFTVADGDSGGRKLTIAQQTSASVTDDGTAAHIALSLSGDTTLRYITTCTEQVLTSGGTVTVPAWTITVGDPA